MFYINNFKNNPIMIKLYNPLKFSTIFNFFINYLPIIYTK